jgi:hypothetical protein
LAKTVADKIQSVIKSSDGLTDKMPDHQLALLPRGKDDNRYASGQSIKDSKRRVIDSIESYDVKNYKYTVTFDRAEEDTISSKNFRQSNLTKLSSIKLRYRVSQKDISTTTKKYC